MEAIKHIIRTPRNHEVTIKIPRHIPENDPVEIILILKQKSDDFSQKINEIKNAMKDKLFIEDMKEIKEDFKNIDIESWDSK